VAKALILDSLLVDVHFTLWIKYKPDFSNLFLNSGAHIQHHYLFYTFSMVTEYNLSEEFVAEL